MKKYIIKLFFGAAFISVIPACTKKLEQVNPNAQTSATFWKTADDALQGVNAAYGSLLIDGAYMRFTPALLDVRGDDVKSNSPWTALANIGRFALGVSDPAGYGWAYGAYYEGVSRSNQVLDYVPAIAMDAGLKDRILGQAYFLRGLYFFHLVNFFGKVALPMHYINSKDKLIVAQSSEADGWKQVEADFKQAADLLPVSYKAVTGADNNQVGRATKGAALAFLGKAYLFNKDFASAGAQFKAVMDLGIYSLVANYKDNFRDGDAFENNSESVFEVQFSRDAGGKDLGWGGAPATGWGKTSARAITFAPRSFGWTDIQPTRSVYDEFQLEQTTGGAVDPRIDATLFYNKPGGEPMYQTTFFDRYGSNAGDLNDLFCRKYENGDGDRADEFDWRSGINERIMRYADVLLMYAECQNEGNQTADAAKYIQQVRTRVNLPDREAEFAAYTQQQLRDQLAHERLLEFCLEGHRFDDIRRWGWLKDPAKLAVLKQRDPEFNSYQPGREYYPIPQSELDNDPAFTQNDTY
ncbi:RagB/SusD family nutrient uptake outer membrane protein [Flavitalea flava]